MESASQGFKTLLWLNGGACLALLALTSSLATTDRVHAMFQSLMAALPYALFSFAAGALMSGMAWFLTYISNQQYANAILNPDAANWSLGSRLDAIGFSIAALSMLMFAIGAGVIGYAML